MWDDRKALRNICTRISNCIHVWRPKPEKVVFVVLILVQLVPIWAFEFFPSTDGPSHIENANILLNYNHPQLTVFREYFLLNEKLASNWLLHCILAGLMGFLPPLISEKIVLSGYVIFLPITVRYALTSISPNAGFLAFLSFPFVFNHTAHMGFYSFSYSTVMFFLVFGYWLKYREKFTPRKIATLALLSIILYLFHIVSLVMAYLGIGLVILLDFVKDFRAGKSDIKSLWKAFRTKVRPLLFGFLPVAALVMTFVNQEGLRAEYGMSILRRLTNLFLLVSLISYDRNEVWLSGITVCFFVGMSLFILMRKKPDRQSDPWGGFLLIAITYGLLCLITPEQISGGSYMNSRLTLFPFFALILWFGVESYKKRAKYVIILTSTGIALAFLGYHTAKYAELNSYLSEYMSGMSLIKPNSTLLPLSFSHEGRRPDGQPLSRRISPFLHAAGFIAAQRQIVEFTNYEANSGLFPTIWRPNLNPYLHMGKIEAEPPEVDFITYQKRTGGRVDYVLIWGIIPKGLGSYEAAESIFMQLEKQYTLIYTSPERGLMRLYRRNY